MVGCSAGFLSLQLGIEWLTDRPWSLIYEVADWTRKHNGDSPSHLPRETPESSNFMHTKASSSLGSQWHRKPTLSSPFKETVMGQLRFLALGGDRGSFVTWPLLSTQAWTSAAHPLP